MSDGTNPAADMSSGISSPIDLDGDGITDIDYSATKANISYVLNQLATQLTKQDYLFIYTIDHGGLDTERNESCLVLWNNERLYASDFSEMVNSIQTKATHIVMGQCHSGGFLDYFSGNPKVCISTACKKDELSYSMSNQEYDEYVYYWTKSHYSYLTADLNDDEYISAWESHQYAQKMDNRAETPQHWGSGLLSPKLALTGFLYANYVNGYCTIDDRQYSFYAGVPNHEPEFGVAGGDKIDIVITEPEIESSFLWSVVEGNNYASTFTGNNTRAHLEVLSQSAVGQKIKIKVHYCLLK